MYATILRGQVCRENWGRLQTEYEKLLLSKPEEVLETFLLQSEDQPNLWQIVTLWRSEKAFRKAVEEKKTEACEALFCDMGSVPERLHFHVRRGFERI
ncbi:hypothetical protein [Anaerolinea sp.]|uniref:hypothetical protein n=1 Tax=Anaerolinea sp. TaxID=1872519 RepID=UPI002ACE0390|nr:hypothetical protein [Anaerolinea sp.]